MRAALLLLLLAACPAPSDTDSDTDVDTDTDSDTDTDTEDTGTPETDEDLVREAIEDRVTDPTPLLADIALRGGWPVHTDAGTWIFVADGAVFPSPHVAGSMNAWTPEALDCSGTFCWVELAADVGDTYKIVTGEAFLADPWARSYTRDEFGEISLVGWPRDRQHVQRWPGMAGAGLKPRTVRVLVPRGDGPWPVLYAHDGQNLFDPEAVWGGWHLDEAVAAMDTPVLVVGVDNTSDRLSEYSVCDDVISFMAITSTGDAYAELVGETIRPHIEDVYGSTGVDGLLGSSMGGLASLHVALKQPGEWDFAGSMSGTLGWGRFDESATGPAIQEQYLAQDPLATVIFVDSGGGDGGDGCTDVDGDGLPEDDPNDSDNYCTNRAFADALAGHGYVWDETLHHWHEPGAPHNEAAWAARVHRPLQIFADLAK